MVPLARGLQTIIIPNAVLNSGELSNLSRSPQPLHYIPVPLDAACTTAQLQELRHRVEAWVKERPTLWVGDKVLVSFAPDSIGATSMKAVIRVQQQGSWADATKTRTNLLDIISFLNETVSQMAIRAKSA